MRLVFPVPLGLHILAGLLGRGETIINIAVHQAHWIHVADAKFYIGLVAHLLWFASAATGRFRQARQHGSTRRTFGFPYCTSMGIIRGSVCQNLKPRYVAIDVLRLASSGYEQGWFKTTLRSLCYCQVWRFSMMCSKKVSSAWRSEVLLLCSCSERRRYSKALSRCWC